MPDQDNTTDPIGAQDTAKAQAGPVAQRVDQEHALRLAEAIEGAAIQDAAEVYQAFAKLAKDGRSWRASDAFLARFLDPIRDQARQDQAGADLPGAVADGSLAELLTDLAERIAQRGGLELAQVGQAGAGDVAQDGAQDVESFADRLDTIRVALIQARIRGDDPGPRRNEQPPPTTSTSARAREGAREAMEPPHGQNVENIGGNEVIDAEIVEDSDARELLMRDRSQGGMDEQEGAS